MASEPPFSSRPRTLPALSPFRRILGSQIGGHLRRLPNTGSPTPPTWTVDRSQLARTRTTCFHTITCTGLSTRHLRSTLPISCFWPRDAFPPALPRRSADGRILPRHRQLPSPTVNVFIPLFSRPPHPHASAAFIFCFSSARLVTRTAFKW
jgi:hypothetical protein